MNGEQATSETQSKKAQSKRVQPKAGRWRQLAHPVGWGVFAGVVGLVGGAAVARVGIERGGSYPVAVAADREGPGQHTGVHAAGHETGGEVFALVVNSGGIDSLRDLWYVMVHQGGPEPAAAPADRRAALAAEENLTSRAESADAAWVAAHRTMGVPIKWGLEPGGDLLLGGDGYGTGDRFGVWTSPNRPTLVNAGLSEGASAGLANAIVFAEHLARQQGHTILGDLAVAATGLVGPSGKVGPVGGIDHKVEAAVAAGVDVVLVPIMNFAEADRQAAGRVEVRGVSTLQAALDVITERRTSKQGDTGQNIAGQRDDRSGWVP